MLPACFKEYMVMMHLYTIFGASICRSGMDVDMCVRCVFPDQVLLCSVQPGKQDTNKAMPSSYAMHDG